MEWRLRSPLASFAEYQQVVGISIKEKKPNAAAVWMKRQFQPVNRGKLILFFSIVILLMATAGSLFGKRAVYSLFYAKAPKNYLYNNWHTATIGRQALEISTPVKLWIHDQPLEKEEANMTEYAKSYRNEDGNGILITVNMRSYRQDITNNLATAVEASHHILQNSREVTDIHCKSVPVLISGMQGVLEEGSYLYKGAIKLAFCNLMMVRESSRWQIYISYRDDDEVGQQVARRVLKSVKIK
ncbi:MAG TPA: hypothetical protein VM802_25220 [Chitinophaga sp.]|uniref:hypothetical protein n=1 Tax=Chitinophaga sp. TaxID=1869181 RepID=UPI002C78E372|nr:hypothetical protein [Chitinophaga sp.]HVI48193.1 hypothetical protein [Chitinophaga sp.]